MKYLSEKSERRWFERAIEIAKQSTCERHKCGSIIVKDNQIIGKGFNSPPANEETQRRCNEDKAELHKKVTDKTCCVHAEQRAIIDALIKNPDKIKNSQLYFIRLDKNDNPTKAGEPYCTICSKFSLDAGIKEFILWHEKNIVSYDTKEYNLLSYKYKE